MSKLPIPYYLEFLKLSSGTFKVYGPFYSKEEGDKVCEEYQKRNYKIIEKFSISNKKEKTIYYYEVLKNRLLDYQKLNEFIECELRSIDVF